MTIRDSGSLAAVVERQGFTLNYAFWPPAARHHDAFLIIQMTTPGDGGLSISI